MLVNVSYLCKIASSPVSEEKELFQKLFIALEMIKS